MRLGVSLASFAAAAETTNVVDRAVELGSQAERLGLDSVWFAQLARIAERRQEAERHEPERGAEDVDSDPLPP